jgi:dUTP pyrophosphatase
MSSKNKQIELGVELVFGGQPPAKAHEDDACYDIFANEDMTIGSQRWAMVRTGFKLQIPKGYMVEIRSRSGLALNNGVTVLNQPATIDAGFKDEVIVILYNSNIANPYRIKRHNRIAQMRLVKLESYTILPITGVDKENDRKGGLGSTGEGDLPQSSPK